MRNARAVLRSAARRTSKSDRLLAGAAAVLGLLSACQMISGGDDRLKPAELVPIQPKAALRILWRGSVGSAGKNVLFPVKSGTVVYAADAAGGVTGFDAARGTVVARIDAGERISGGVGGGGDLVLLGTPKGEVLAFDRGGKSLWRTQVAGEVLAPPTVREGMVAARAGDGRVYGLDAASGKQKWVYQRSTPALSVRTHAGLVVDRGAVFVGFPGGRLVGIALSNGNIGWEAVVAQPRGTTELERVADITSVPVLDGQQVCAAAYQGRVACFDASRGTLLWARDVSSSAGLEMDERNVYVTDDKNAVVALDKSSGASLWRQDKLAGRNVSAPLAVGRYVAVGDFEGYVHLISREDGSFAARIETDGSAISAPPMTLESNSFLVQTRDGGVFAITVQ
jgi:outer membrane protein assembly factor BamB